MAQKSYSGKTPAVLVVLLSAFILATIAALMFIFSAGGSSSGTAQKHLTKTEVEGMVKNYIMENPQIVFDAMEKFYVEKAKHQQEEAKKNIALKSKELENDQDDPRVGEGKVKVVEIFDYNCTYCKQMAQTKAKLLEKNKNVQLIFKEAPIFGEQSVMAAKAALAVNKLDKGKYFAFHTELLQHKGTINETVIEQMVSKLGLNWNSVKKEMDEKSIADHIERNIKLAHEIGIQGTPAYIIAGEVVPGKISLEDLQKLIDSKK